MHLKKLSFALLTALAALPLPAHALDPFGTRKDLKFNPPPACRDADLTHLDLLKAIDLALCRNRDTRAAWAQARTAAANLGVARSAYLPDVTLSASGTRSFPDPGTPSTRYGPQASLSLLLFDFGGREADVDAARNAMLEAGWNYSDAMQTLVYQVALAYADVFTARESLDAAQLSEKASNEAFKAARARLEVGVVTPADTAQAETAYAQNRLIREQAENRLTVAHGTLAALLHLPPDSEMHLAPLTPEADVKKLPTDVKALIEEAKKKRPDLAASRAREAKARADVRKAEALDYPTIGLNASAGRTETTGRSSLDQNDASVGLSVSVPLFTGFSTTYRKEAARRTLDATRLQRESREDEAVFDVWTTYHNLQTAVRSFETAKTLLASAQKSSDLSFGRYKAGAGTLIEALDAQASLADARRQWVEARYNLVVTRYDLARSIGHKGLN